MREPPERPKAPRRLRVGQAKLEHFAVKALFFGPQHGVAADEGRFLAADGKAKAGFQHMIFVGDVMAPVAIGLFDPATVQRVKTAQL